MALGGKKKTEKRKELGKKRDKSDKKKAEIGLILYAREAFALKGPSGFFFDTYPRPIGLGMGLKIRKGLEEKSSPIYLNSQKFNENWVNTQKGVSHFTSH